MKQRASVLEAEIIAVAVAYGLLLELARFAGIFGLPLMILLLASLWRYCYTLLRAFAHGYTRAPLPDVESMNPVGTIAPLLHAVFFMVVIAVLPRALGNGTGGFVLSVAVALPFIVAFPASAAVMGVTGSLGAALNPASIAAVMGVLRGDYLRLMGILVVIVVAPGGVERIVGSGFIGSLIVALIGTWAQLAAFAAIGRAINEHGYDLDLPGEFERRAERAERERDQAWQKPLDNAYASIRSGLAAEGYREIRQLAESEGESLEIYQWLFNRMLLWEDRQHAVAIAVRFVERLLAEGRLHEALDLADQCRRLPKVRFELGPATCVRLVEYARSVNRHLSADELERLAEMAVHSPLVEDRG